MNRVDLNGTYSLEEGLDLRPIRGNPGGGLSADADHATEYVVEMPASPRGSDQNRDVVPPPPKGKNISNLITEYVYSPSQLYSIALLR